MKKKKKDSFDSEPSLKTDVTCEKVCENRLDWLTVKVDKTDFMHVITVLSQ